METKIIALMREAPVSPKTSSVSSVSFATWVFDKSVCRPRDPKSAAQILHLVFELAH
jgi:hypothetical protein